MACRFGVILIFGTALAAPAAAQLPYAPLLVVEEPIVSPLSRRAPPPSFRMPRGDLREAPGPSRNGLLAALPLADNVTLGVGRFRSVDAPRPRAHMEPAHRAAEVRRRERGIAAVGVSLRF